MSVLRECPMCHVTWEGREVPDALMDGNPGYTREQAEEAAKDYGWTPENKQTAGINYIGVEYPYDHPAHYDGVSEWNCTACGGRIGRFTSKILHGEEYEEWLTN